MGEIQLVQESLRRQIASAQPLTTIGVNAAQRSSFSGSEQTLSFVGVMPVRTEAAGLYRFELESSDTDGDRQLELRWSVFRWDQPAAQSAQPRTEALLRDIAGVSFSYFGRPDPDGPPRWIDQWDDGWRLPLLVRLSITFPDGDDRVWPDLVVATRLRGT